jgi:outer membrane protein assembly factor BamB
MERLRGQRLYGKGRLVCMEINEDTLEPTLIWENRDVFRTQCTPSVVGDLLFIADTLGFLHCLDVRTGEEIWKHDLGAKVSCRSQIVADGKVYVTTDANEYWVLRAGPELEVLANMRMKDAAATVEAIDNHLLMATHRDMTLYRKPGAAE